jgi:hypothetical protein
MNKPTDHHTRAAESLAAVIRRAAVNCISQLEREAREARKNRDIELAMELERDADEIRIRAAEQGE